MSSLWDMVWGSPQADEREQNNPYVAAMLHGDTHEHDMRRTIRVLCWGACGLFVALGGSLYSNIYQLTQAKVEYQLVMVDRHYQPVTTMARQASVLTETDPLKQGIVANFLRAEVTNLVRRTRDEGLLTNSQNAAGDEMAGPALKTFQIAFKAQNPFEQARREAVEVSEIDPPVALSNRTWVVSWRQTVADSFGNSLREESWMGQFQIEQIPKRSDPFNIFGLTIVNYTLQQVK